MSSACVLWFRWPHLRSGARQINQLDGIEYVAARERVLKTPECRDGQHCYRQEFGSVDLAFQKVFKGERGKARNAVMEQINSHLPEVLSYADFLVLDQKLTVSIQTTVPVPHGYGSGM